MDVNLDMMKRHGIPETRENYLALADVGEPPDELSAEQELELPRQFQLDPPEEF
jgi:hypothetical protein